jgi:DNA-3-methyladenine glycosylase I
VPDVVEGEDGMARCFGSDGEPMRSYHDLEWGRPVADDRRLFEKLSLEGFLSGLSWLTILRKRENFRRAFRSFDIDTVARFNERSVARLMADAANRATSLSWQMVQSISPDAAAMSKDLKRRGWAFVGPTNVYAFMQAMGLVNDHLSGCFAREEVEQARRAFRRPG